MSSANFAANFAATLQQQNNSIDNYYTNARYSPTGDQQTGQPFPAYKQYAGSIFTDWHPSGSRDATYMKQFNLPTNTNLFRQAFTQSGVGVANDLNTAWVQQSQSLATVGNPVLCTSNADCAPYPGTTCNANYEPWPGAKGNQSGSFCSTTVYPELANGNYFRKNTNQGGIGRGCSTDSDCGEGYSCNNEVDFNGASVQQTGYCSQRYQCPDGSAHFLGYPYGAGIPQPPPPNQNNNGAGYQTQDQCKMVASSQQDCVRGGNGMWYAVYPGYCPVPSSLREGGPRGPIMTSSPQQLKQGIYIPGYATNNASNWGSNQKVASFESWSLGNPQPNENGGSMNQAFSYATSLDPRPSNLN